MPSFRIGQPITVQHLKPGRPDKLVQMRGRVAFYNGALLLVERRFQSPGRPYDGLHTVQEAGDYGTIQLVRGAWVSRRRYFRRDGHLIGELYNVQTPTVFRPPAARYVDLEIDVAYLPDLTPQVEVQDTRELEEAVDHGYIPGDIAALARHLADELATRLQTMAGRPELWWDIRPDERKLTPEARDFLRRQSGQGERGYKAA